MTKMWLIVAASLIALGLIIFVVAMTVCGWDFARLSTVEYVDNTYDVEDEFLHISIETITADIVFAPSPDGTCRVECHEEEKLQHSVSVKDNTLTIRAEDERVWYDHVGIHFGKPKITVYLPDSVYGKLLVKGTTADVELSQELWLERLDVSLTTGDVRVENITVQMLDVTVTTGNVTIRNVDCQDDVKIKVSTGKTNLTDIQCWNFFSEGTTGDIELRNVVAVEKLSIRRTTGDAVLDGCDAIDIYVETATGDITGTLLTGKVYLASTTTGKIRVPENRTAGRCELVTTTGDIIFC